MKLISLTSFAIGTSLAHVGVSGLSFFDPEAQTPLISTSKFHAPPALGFGTWNLHGSNATAAVSAAIVAGYRHIDCAAAYGNEQEVGKGIADGLKKAGLRREDIWVTSKLWNDHHDPKLVPLGLAKTLKDLGLLYLDLYLMHWPVSSSSDGNQISYVDTWKALSILPTVTVRHTGICNFSPSQLSNLLEKTAIPPFAHQMELHPYLPQTSWLQYHYSHGIHVTAYSPLGNSNPTYHPSDPPLLLRNPVLKTIAKERKCTPAQVSLKWGLSRGTSVIPKSKHEAYIKENLDSEACELEYEDFQRLEVLGKGGEDERGVRFNNPSKGWGVKLFEGLDGL